MREGTRWETVGKRAGSDKMKIWCINDFFKKGDMVANEEIQ